MTLLYPKLRGSDKRSSGLQRLPRHNPYNPLPKSVEHNLARTVYNSARSYVVAALEADLPAAARYFTILGQVFFALRGEKHLTIRGNMSEEPIVRIQNLHKRFGSL